MSRYYDDLSADSSVNHQDEEDDENSIDEDHHQQLQPLISSFTAGSRKSPAMKRLLPAGPLQPNEVQEEEALVSSNDRYIIHVDVDCFYCQCEAIDRGLPPDRPFAIGQKHIIVTCNYVARAQGVQKLQSRESALKACPSLVIYEGSDLERYRKHARSIYQTFRQACKRWNDQISVSKGSMDEMMADVTPYVVALRHQRQSGDANFRFKSNKEESIIKSCYIYGERGPERTVLTEDQTGQQTVVVFHDAAQSTSKRYENVTIQHNLEITLAPLALEIRQAILDQTGFTTTFGLSVNPLLAKIASGLRKPATVNLLYPWRSQTLLAAMPCRKLPGLGRSMMKALQPCLEREHADDERTQHTTTTPWTCRHLMQVPLPQLASALQPVVLDSWYVRLRRILSSIDSSPPWRSMTNTLFLLSFSFALQESGAETCETLSRSGRYPRS